MKHHYRTRLFALSLLVLSTLIVNAQAPTNGLIAYYPFNGNSDDESGNTNNGVITGAVFTTDRFNAASKALEFGTNRYVEIAGTSSLSLTNQATFSIWLYPTQHVYPFNALFQRSSVCSHEGGQWSAGITNSRTGLLLSRSNCSFVQSADSYSFSLNQWHHVLFIWNGTTIKTYVNGVFLQETSASLTLTYENRPLYIGGNLDGPNEYFYGKLDDVRIYNRALAESEINSLYMAESPALVTAKNGIWNDPTTWQGNRVPAAIDAVDIRHIIDIPTNITHSVRQVQYQSTGKVNLGNNAKLQLTTN